MNNRLRREAVVAPSVSSGHGKEQTVLLNLLLALGPAPIVDAVPLSPTIVALVRADGSVSIAELTDLLAGRDRSSTLLFSGDDALGPPTTYKLEYRSALGTITVTTPCSGYNSIDECARAFKRAVEASQREIPKLPD